MSTDPLKLCMVQGSASHLAGGLFNSVRNLSQSLDTLGADVAILAPQDHKTQEDLPEWAPLKPICPPRRGPASLGYAPAVSDYLRNLEVDVLHQHGIWQAFSAQVTAWRKRTGRPVMISPRGMLDPWALRNAQWKKRLVGLLFEQTNLKGATCLHALNESEANSIRTFGLTAPIAVIPNGTHLPPASQQPPPRPAFLPRDGRSTLLFLGRLHPKKGIAELLSAMALVRARDPDLAKAWRLVIAGWDDGGFDEDPKAQMQRLGLADQVIFAGPLLGADKAAMLSHADAFILPSHSEGLPMSILEAWAYGLPVLMTGACNLPEGFSENAALQIDTDPVRLAEQLCAALPQDLSAMAVAGQNLAATRFSWHQIAKRHMAVYRFLRDGGPAPADLRLTS